MKERNKISGRTPGTYDSGSSIYLTEYGEKNQVGAKDSEKYNLKRTKKEMFQATHQIRHRIRLRRGFPGH